MLTEILVVQAPPGKSSLEREVDFITEHKFAAPEIETVSNLLYL